MNADIHFPATLPEPTRNTVALVHLSALVGLLGNGIGFLLGPLVTWQLKRKDHPAVDAAGKAALNFQLTMLVVVLVSIPLCFILIGFLPLLAAVVLATICPIVAAVRTTNGEPYVYPFAITFLK